MTPRTLTLAALGLVLLATVAEARPRPAGQFSGRQFVANKTFGLGLELGAPLGLTGKYFISSDRAIDFGVGGVYGYYNRRGFHVYADYVFHPVSLASNEHFELPLYIGLGGRLWAFEDRDVAPYDDAYAIGFRVPVGISFDFNKVPLDAFVQLIPVLDFFSGYDRHSVYIDLNASVGIRFWFN